MNHLWFGDNLDILREEIATESVDLVYLDPPFNSNANYNVLFKSPAADAAGAQVEAFRDTWTWGNEAQWALDEIMRAGGSVATIIHALHSALGESDMMAYLVMMAQRLSELQRVLRANGSLYLHCDPTASHYLKIILDNIFGVRNFRSEIIWKRSHSHNSAIRYGPIHDVIFFYTKSETFTWNKIFVPLADNYINSHYKYEENGRRYKRQDITGPGVRHGETGLPWRGIDPTAKRRHWMRPPSELDKLDADGLIYWPSNHGGWPYLKKFLDKSQGQLLQDIWTDINPINPVAQERLGYPTQKPVALLDRIVRASSNPDDVILDPFCGCGTTIAAAQMADRRWVGIDVAYHAIRVIEGRLASMLKSVPYQLGGIPRDFESAERLAQKDKFQFQWWANYLVGVQALKEVKKGPDRGIDGQMYFMNGPRGWGKILTSVKGGQHVGAKDVREFKAVLERDRAEMGLFICLHPPTREMASEAASFGFAETAHGHLPRLQVVSVSDWFKGRRPALPSLGHVSREFFEPQESFKVKKVKRPDPNAPEFRFSFPGQKQDGAFLYLNPLALSEQKSA